MALVPAMGEMEGGRPGGGARTEPTADHPADPWVPTNAAMARTIS